MFVAISMCYWSIIKIYSGMVCFFRFPWENNFMSLFGYIWVKRHLPLINPFANFDEIRIHNLCRKQRIIYGRKSDVSSANNFAKDSKLSGRWFIYTRKSKSPSIEPCGTPTRTGDQFEEWLLRTTLWNLSLSKLWKILCKLPEIPTVSTLFLLWITLLSSEHLHLWK